MENTVPAYIEGLGTLGREELKRAAWANDEFSRICSEKGIKVSSWDDFPACNQFVSGKIPEPQLSEKAALEISTLSPPHGSPVVVKEEEPSSIRRDPIKRERARIANKIYKKVCHEKGLNFCFFSNFATWIDYVQGRIGEAQFHEGAEREAEKMAARTSV